MQSSFNIIKNNSVKNTGLRDIITSGETAAAKAENIVTETNVKNHIESYENLAKNIIENARRQSEQILIRAYEDAKSIEEEALKQAERLKSEAYEQGAAEGYNTAYNETLNKAKVDGDAIIASASKLLNNAKEEYEIYMQAKSKEIGELALTIAKAVLKKEIQDTNSINSMIYDALSESKNSRNFIIRCSSIYVEELKKQCSDWKQQLGFKGDIFIVGDDTLEPGNAVIDKGNGKIVVGIDYALQRVEEILNGKE